MVTHLSPMSEAKAGPSPRRMKRRIQANVALDKIGVKRRKAKREAPADTTGAPIASAQER